MYLGLKKIRDKTRKRLVFKKPKAEILETGFNDKYYWKFENTFSSCLNIQGDFSADM